MSKGNRTKPKFAGLDERDATNNQTDVPSTYFAGVTKLNGSPLMGQVITKIKNAGQGK